VTSKTQERRPADPEERRRFLVLLFSRAALISALLGSTIFFNLRSSLLFFSASQVMLYGIVAVVYLGTGASLLWLKFGRLNIGLHVQGQIVFDVLVAAFLVYLTGGVESPFCFFLALPVIVTTVFSSRRGTFLTASLSCLFLGAVFILENRGILPVMPEGRAAPPPATGRIVYLLALNYTAYFAIAWLSGTLGEKLRRTGRRLEETEIDLERLEVSVRRAEKMAALGKMAAGMAHEIRNPLASISGAVQVLKKAPGFADADRRLADIILRETRRLDALLTNFLAYARPRELRPKRCDLGELVEETVSVYTGSLDGGRPRVGTEIEKLSARVDADQIRQVLWNLLKNAVEAAPARVWVRLRTVEDAAGVRRAVIEVADDGPAIAADIRERIFEPFFTTKEEGSGLGLATVSRIVEAHGGSISLDSPAGGGNRFSVLLPGMPGVNDE